MRPKPLALIIMDGWGENVVNKGNAIKLAETPYVDQLFSTYPHSQLQASGRAVGLPEGQMGNSEVGHLNLGSGRVVYQDLTRISLAVETGEIKTNPVLGEQMKAAYAKDKALHLLGLLSDGGVHSHIDHLFGLLEMAKDFGLEKVYVHAILDGRDVPPDSAQDYVRALENKLAELGVGQIASISGRYYTMDRDNRWERVEKAYRAMVLGEGLTAPSALEAINNAYSNEETDEFVSPTTIVSDQGQPLGTIGQNDLIIFYNFRADRARQITQALALADFTQFDRSEYLDPQYVCLTEYDQTFNLPIAFPPEEIAETLGQVLSAAGLKQLRIAETEKYAHVTFFFNGGREEPSSGEDRKLIPSPKVATYDLEPKMSAFQMTDHLLEELNKDLYDVIILNYANCDMVGHTGKLDAAIQAVETVDQCLEKLIPAILKTGGQILLTSDHGNAEKMLEGPKPHTAHTTNPVPLIYIGGEKDVNLRAGGVLADIAPTMLDILEIPQPKEMTGKSLLLK